MAVDPSKLPQTFHWLPEDVYSKARTQLYMQVGGVFDFLRVDDKLPIRYQYGTGVFVEGAIKEIVKLCEDFGLRVRGLDKPVSLDYVRRSK